jgi:hypothetical protein
MTDRYYARPATYSVDWRYWSVADREKGGLNVTSELIRQHLNPSREGAVFTDRGTAEYLAKIANGGAA